MDASEFVQLIIEITDDVTEEELDRLTRNLLSELKATDVESAELGEAGAPRGTKSADAATIGSIVVSTLPTVLPTIVAVVQAWVSRGSGRTVKFKGKGIEFEGSAEEFQKLLATLEKGQKKAELRNSSNLTNKYT